MLEHLVIDAGGILRGVKLDQLAKNFWTTTDVLGEIKDKKAKARLEALPFELKVREPSDAAMGAVVAFARQTGDFAFLSRTDLRVLALTYMFESEENGIEHLRTAPKLTQIKVTRGRKQGTDFATATAKQPKQPSLETQMKQVSISAESIATADQPTLELNQESDATADPPTLEMKQVSDAIDLASLDMQQMSIAADSLPVVMEDEALVVEQQDEPEECNALETIEEETNEPEPEAPAAVTTMTKFAPTSKILSANTHGVYTTTEEDDGVNWINGSNFEQFLESPFGSSKSASKDEDQLLRVGCITTDYAMQNVMLQMGLHLISADGMVIKKLKQWVMRCVACFHVISRTDKVFCPRCGNSTLERVAANVDKKTGKLRVFSNPQRSERLRGTKYSIPKPTGGRTGNLLLREDQMLSGIWGQRVRQSSKKVKCAFGEYLATDIGVTSMRGPDITVGFGRRNPNAQRGRERRGKKKRKPQK